MSCALRAKKFCVAISYQDKNTARSNFISIVVLMFRCYWIRLYFGIHKKIFHTRDSIIFTCELPRSASFQDVGPESRACTDQGGDASVYLREEGHENGYITCQSCPKILWKRKTILLPTTMHLPIRGRMEYGEGRWKRWYSSSSCLHRYWQLGAGDATFRF